MANSTPVFLPDDDAPTLPDWPRQATRILPDEASTEALAGRLADVVRPGDVLLLSGALGAGKSHLARTLIRAWMGSPDEPVPSPTYTLVQTYGAARGEVWHADLYRLGDPGEIRELGLTDALGEAALCLVEWPDRLAPDWPEAALLHLERRSDDTRGATLLAAPGLSVDHLKQALNS